MEICAGRCFTFKGTFRVTCLIDVLETVEMLMMQLGACNAVACYRSTFYLSMWCLDIGRNHLLLPHLFII